MPAQIVTANRLRDGAVVYLSQDGEWTKRIDGAAVAEAEADAAALLAAAEGAVAAQQVVGPYLIAVRRVEGHIEPARYRERLRAEGPSVPVGRAASPSISG